MLSTISCVYWPSIFLLWRNVYLDLLPIILFYFFLNIELHELFVFLEINPLSTALFVNILSHSEVCLFVLLMVSFAVQKFLSLIGSQLFILFLFSLFQEVVQKRSCCDLCQRVFFLCFPPRVL